MSLPKFEGYKTYIVALLVGLLAVAKFLGYVSPELYETLLGLLVGTGLYTLRSAVKKLE